MSAIFKLKKKKKEFASNLLIWTASHEFPDIFVMASDFMIWFWKTPSPKTKIFFDKIFGNILSHIIISCDLSSS